MATQSEIIDGYVVEREFQFRLEIVTADYDAWREFSARLLALGSIFRSVPKRGVN